MHPPGLEGSQPGEVFFADLPDNKSPDSGVSEPVCEVCPGDDKHILRCSFRLAEYDLS